jgi:hypothetical protein
MKLIIIGITTFLLCNTIDAQVLCSNYQFKKTGFYTEGFEISDNLNSEKLFEDNFISTRSKLKYPLMGAASGTPYLLAAFSGNNSSWDEGLKMNMKTRKLISAGLFIPTIATGYLMRGSNGNPNDGLLAVHKLSTVSNLVLLDTTLLKKRKTTSLTWMESLVAIAMNVSFVATITTGGLQSVGKPIPEWVNTSHRISPWVTVLSSGTLLYLLNE